MYACVGGVLVDYIGALFAEKKWSGGKDCTSKQLQKPSFQQLHELLFLPCLNFSFQILVIILAVIWFIAFFSFFSPVVVYM